jgi:hypothetical protein
VTVERILLRLFPDELPVIEAALALFVEKAPKESANEAGRVMTASVLLDTIKLGEDITKEVT